MFFAFTLVGCSKRRTEQPLIGTYQLVNPSGCRDDIQDSTLLVRGDGTYDQKVQFKNGKIEAVKNERWTYDRAGRRINFSKVLISTESSYPAEASHPAVIIVNRAGNCWYQHPK